MFSFPICIIDYSLVIKFCIGFINFYHCIIFFALLKLHKSKNLICQLDSVTVHCSTPAGHITTGAHGVQEMDKCVEPVVGQSALGMLTACTQMGGLVVGVAASRQWKSVRLLIIQTFV